MIVELILRLFEVVVILPFEQVFPKFTELVKQAFLKQELFEQTFFKIELLEGGRSKEVAELSRVERFFSELSQVFKDEVRVFREELFDGFDD